MKLAHIPILQDVLLDSLKLHSNGIIVDCTLGFGGHSLALLETYKQCRIVGIDRDETALNLVKTRFEQAGLSDRVEFFHSDFGSALGRLPKEQLHQVCAIIADIGVSSMQLDDKARGFSFESSNLDMRMDTRQAKNAHSVINTYSAYELERVLRDYGEIRESKKLTNAIMQARPITSGIELCEVVGKVLPRTNSLHPATRVFQAIRIEVNGELAQLQSLLDFLKQLARSSDLANVRVCVISFHSLEDRIIKNAFRDFSLRCICPANVMKCECGGNNALGNIITKKPLLPNEKEIQYNPRARSAKMRIFDIQSKGK